MLKLPSLLDSALFAADAAEFREDAAAVAADVREDEVWEEDGRPAL